MNSYVEKHEELLSNIKSNLNELENILIEVNNHWGSEDCIYRFYHHSFKVYYIQSLTVKIVDILKKIAPKDVTFNAMFNEILEKGINKKFKMIYNKNWMKHTKPLLEAFFHAKYFLEMAIKYGKELEKAPNCLPSGWASVLYLFNLR